MIFMRVLPFELHLIWAAVLLHAFIRPCIVCWMFCICACLSWSRVFHSFLILSLSLSRWMCVCLGLSVCICWAKAFRFGTLLCFCHFESHSPRVLVNIFHFVPINPVSQSLYLYKFSLFSNLCPFFCCFFCVWNEDVASVVRSSQTKAAVCTNHISSIFKRLTITTVTVHFFLLLWKYRWFVWIVACFFSFRSVFAWQIRVCVCMLLKIFIIVVVSEMIHNFNVPQIRHLAWNIAADLLFCCWQKRHTYFSVQNQNNSTHFVVDKFLNELNNECVAEFFFAFFVLFG